MSDCEKVRCDGGCKDGDLGCERRAAGDQTGASTDGVREAVRREVARKLVAGGNKPEADRTEAEKAAIARGPAAFPAKGWEKYAQPTGCVSSSPPRQPHEAVRRVVESADDSREAAEKRRAAEKLAALFPGDAQAGPKYAPEGLAFARVFSGGPGPKMVERTAEIKDHKGDVVFRQEGVLFPEEYSQTAVNVVASKYFYGDKAIPGARESSLLQLVGRVTSSIADWGREDGYFRSEEDARVFEDELTALCVGQYGSFNSPVWFNVGLHKRGVRGDYDGFRWDRTAGRPVPVAPGTAYQHPQAGACFIVGVEDSIDAIYERAKIEGRIFKYGSGAGSNNSAIRSSRELVRGGGKPSGPLSFMQVYDAVAKVTKSGGVSRRAAKMELLDVSHPDVMEFIVCKETEEAKAHALIREGYPADYNGEAYSSVCFQNSNMSVRFSDEFMAKVAGEDPDRTWRTTAVTTGTHFNTNGVEMPVYDADDLFTRVAEGTWLCGDPGVQYSDTINRWNTVKAFGPIRASNPCSEFLQPDNTSCNLASLNLLKFRTEDGGFDADRFAAAVRTFIAAQEILVDRAGYPTEAICRNSHDLRPLGLGYSNLGALLMSYGLPYDSDAGRTVAGLVTALMHAEANRTSSELAAVVGPFPAYRENAASMLLVMHMHRDQLARFEAVDPTEPAFTRLLRSRVRGAWDGVLAAGERSGFRNSQVTLLAPTGTISFAMDCDTTGVEPELALVKHKLLAGGGTMKLVNRTVELALRTLGYAEPAIAAIRGHIDANDTIEGAPGIRPEHLPVFDCSFPAGPSARTIHHRGHLRMMAAVQPWLSGSISKTVNMPEDSTVADVKAAYLEAWRLGLKCVAIYRDGSKKSQPLTTKKAEDAQTAPAVADDLADLEKAFFTITDVADMESPSRPAPRRERLPDTRDAVNHKFSVGGHKGYLNVGLFEDGRPGELFITMSKEGSTVGGLMDVIGTLMSMCWQYGVPLEVITDKLSHVRFEPQGFTPNPDIPMAKSVVDYIARWLAARFIPGWREENCPNREAATGPEAALPAPASAVARPPRRTSQADAPACPNCGAITRRAGSCYTCEQCGSSTGCG